MFGKLLLVILVMGAVACILLVNRQQRIETVHESARLYRGLMEQRQTMWTLRGEISARCRPERVRLATEALGDHWTPLRRPRPDAPDELAASYRTERAAEDRYGALKTLLADDL